MYHFYFCVIEFTLISSYFDNFQPGEYVLYKNKDYEVEVGLIVRTISQTITVIISIGYDSVIVMKRLFEEKFTDVICE